MDPVIKLKHSLDGMCEAACKLYGLDDLTATIDIISEETVFTNEAGTINLTVNYFEIGEKLGPYLTGFNKKQQEN